MSDYTHKSCCGFVTIDSTETLCIPKHLQSIAGHFTPSTFFCYSAVCLLISQNVNKKMMEIFRLAFLGTKKLKINFS